MTLVSVVSVEELRVRCPSWCVADHHHEAPGGWLPPNGDAVLHASAPFAEVTDPPSGPGEPAGRRAGGCAGRVAGDGRAAAGPPRPRRRPGRGRRDGTAHRRLRRTVHPGRHPPPHHRPADRTGPARPVTPPTLSPSRGQADGDRAWGYGISRVGPAVDSRAAASAHAARAAARTRSTQSVGPAARQSAPPCDDPASPAWRRPPA